jgi:ferredoxin-NADP reductase/YHS domain-containing protein
MHDHNHDEQHHHHHHGEPADPQAIDPAMQATCIVTGDVVNKKEAEDAGHVREYNGHAYYFCCNTCVQLFEKNPDKYTAHHTLTLGLKLIEKENLVDNVWAFRFEPTTPLAWVAGQFIRVELPHDNPDAEGTKRWFTVSSAPYEGIIQITTRVTESTFKQALAALPVGDRLPLLEKPDGDFVWQDTGKPLVFVAGGIGITPFRSILKQRAHENLPLSVTLVYGNRTDDIVFKEEFDEYAQNNAAFKVQYVTGEPLTAEKLTELMPGLHLSLVYLSGPEPMVEALGDQLKAVGLPEAQLKQDFFPNYTEANY